MILPDVPPYLPLDEVVRLSKTADFAILMHLQNAQTVCPALRQSKLVLGGMLIAAGIVLATLAVRSFRQAGTNVEPWKPSVTLVADVHGNDPFYRWSCHRAWV